MSTYIIIILLLSIVLESFYLIWLSRQLKTLKKHSKKLLSQKKSSEVLTGHITEKFVPFLKAFKHDPQQSNFLGQPIDYLVFGDSVITFVEVKSGNSRLSAKQKRIKKLVQEKQVEWEEIRVK